MTEPHDLLVVGRVRNAHGLRGELAVEILTDEPDAVFASGRRLFGGTVDPVNLKGGEVHVVRTSPFKGGLIVSFQEITDRTSAEAWRHLYLLAPANELSPLEDGEVYLHELPGMRVELEDGSLVGTVKDTYELPQGVVMDVRREKGTVMIPFNEEIVTRVDREARLVVVAPPDGLLD